MSVSRSSLAYRWLISTLSRTLRSRAERGVVALALTCGAAAGSHAQSFTVDDMSFGVPGTAVGALALAPQHIFTNVAPPGPIPPSVPFSGMNFVDVFSPNSPDRDALSAGYEPLDAEKIFAITFSVDRRSQGVVGSAVRARASAGHGVGSDLYYASVDTGPGTNRLLSVNDVHHGLSDGPLMGLNVPDNIDGAEVFDSRTMPEAPYQGFNFLGDAIFDSVNTGSTLDAVIRVNGAPFIRPERLGLQEKDNIDALALDYGFEKNGRGDGTPEVLFSLAPGSATLAGPDGVHFTADDLSPGDVFYSDLSGAFDIAGPTGLLGKFPGNFAFPFDLTARNLGLQFFPEKEVMDNLDALDVLASRTIYKIPEDPQHPTAVPPPGQIPVPGDFNLSGRVSEVDLRWWQNGFGQPSLAPTSDGDADGDGDVDGRDFLIWQRNFGLGDPAAPAALAAVAAVPEPTCAWLAGIGLVAGALRRTGRREN